MSPELLSIARYFLKHCPPPMSLQKLHALVCEVNIDYARLAGTVAFQEHMEFHDGQLSIPQLSNRSNFSWNATINPALLDDGQVQPLGSVLVSCQRVFDYEHLFFTVDGFSTTLSYGSFIPYLESLAFPSGSLIAHSYVLAHGLVGLGDAC